MENKSVSLHQKLMDEAYAEFKKHEDWGMDEFYFHIDGLHRIAVALGNLNYQVCNGGFSQWSFNGYQELSLPTLRVVRKDIIESQLPELTKALDLAINYRQDVAEDDGDYNDRKDGAYYALKNIEAEMEQYLNDVKKVANELK
jgi:hypothetical protein